MLQPARSSPVIAGVGSHGLRTVHRPQVADGGHLNVMAVSKLRRDQVQIVTAVPIADMPDRNAIIRADNVGVRRGRAGEYCASRNRDSGFTKKVSAVHRRRIAHKWLQKTQLK